MKFTRRSVRNTFYPNRRKLANKKARDLPHLDFESDANIFISVSLTPYTKKLFGNVKKEKKFLKLKFIWSFNERQVKRFQDEHPRIISQVDYITWVRTESLLLTSSTLLLHLATNINFYYIDTDEIPGFVLLLKNISSLAQ